MATTTSRRGGWPLPSLSPSALTFRNVFIFLFISVTFYTAISLTGVLEPFKHNQFVTYSQSLTPSSWPFFNHDPKEIGRGYTSDVPLPPSDELSDFYIYNITKTDVTNPTKTWPRPQLHVLIDARNYHPAQERTNLRRTLLSVVIQGYPPPILIGYQQPDIEERENEREDASSTEAFLKAALNAMEYTKLQSGEERRGDQEQENLVLFLGQNHWVQMPAEVTVRRFLQHKEVWGRRLVKEYEISNSSTGRDTAGGDGKPETDVVGNKKSGLGVLFPASRRKPCAKRGDGCNYGTKRGNDTRNFTSERTYPDGADHRDNFLPESSLPRDIYGTFSDADSTEPSRYTRPRYLGGGSFIGSAEDIERLFRGALERVDWLMSNEAEGSGAREDGSNGDFDELTYLFSEMLFEQEIERRRLQEMDSISQQNVGEKARRNRQRTGPMVEEKERKNRFLDWFTQIMGGKGHPSTPSINSNQQQQQTNNTNKIHGHEYEFGIGLDYESRIFQDMADDLPEDPNDNGNSPRSVQITNDIRYLSYNAPNLVRSPSQSAAHFFRRPLMLPPELLHPLSPNGTSSPFGLNSVIYNNVDSILEEAKKLKVIASAEDMDQEKLRAQGRKTKRQEQFVDTAEKNEQAEKKDGEENITKLGKMTRIPWSSLEFATNVVVPRGSIPSILDMSRFGGGPVPAAAQDQDRETTDEDKKASEQREAAQKILDEQWEKMWFNQKKTRRPPPLPQHQDDEHRKRDGGDDGINAKTATETETEAAPAKYDLLGEYNKPSPFIYALESQAWGGEHSNWWNVRGGRGGCWTDQGAWVSWSDICGDVDV